MPALDLALALAPAAAWQHFTSPATQWATMPSFVVGQILFVICAGVALVHAWRAGRDHLLIWIAALIAGTANDLIFMGLPIVNNFWQAQGLVMLSERLPLYIPCVYVCFMYYPTVAVRRLGLEPLALAVASGLLACLFYAPYDIVGAKFSWWTWHDTDPPIASRLLGAPISSSLWTLTFVASFAWLVDRALRIGRRDQREASDEPVTAKTFAIGLGLVAGCTTLLMVVQMTVLQQIDGGTPSYGAFAVAVAVYLALAAWRGSRQLDPAPPREGDRLLLGAALLYFVTLIGIMVSFDPATHRNTSAHQTVGECYVEQTDITGMTRYEFLCVEDFDEDFDFACLDAPPEPGARWYTVCAKPHENFAAMITGVGLLGLVGIGLFTLLLGPGRARLPLRRRSSADDQSST